MSDKPRRVLIVEDEAKLARLLADYLERSGFSVDLLGDGNDALAAVRAAPPALVLLDVMLPGRDGLEVCREIRTFSNVPIVMVTARVEEIDRLLGLELGADDYVCKPFSPREVVARVRAVLRRASEPLTRDASRGDPIELDRAAYRVRAGAREATLTTVEFHLFDGLFSEPGRIFSRTQLMDRIYADHRIVSDRTVDSHVKKLRRKLAVIAPDYDLVHSVYGAGYRYEPTPVDGGE